MYSGIVSVHSINRRNIFNRCQKKRQNDIKLAWINHFSNRFALQLRRLFAFVQFHSGYKAYKQPVNKHRYIIYITPIITINIDKCMYLCACVCVRDRFFRQIFKCSGFSYSAWKQNLFISISYHSHMMWWQTSAHRHTIFVINGA